MQFLTALRMAPWICILGLMIACGYYKGQANKWHERSLALSAKLEAISTAKNEQKQVTERTVEKVVKGDPVVRTVVKTIHDAPNPPDCKTPGIEQLRTVL